MRSAAGRGVRLSPDDIDYEKGVLYVRRQVQTFCGRLYFALPKGGKTRVADMPSSVACELREHSRKYPAVEVELPWGEPGKPTRTVSLLLTTRFGNAIAVNTYNTYVWKPALARVGSSLRGLRVRSRGSGRLRTGTAFMC